jgi:hypothetical protein
MPEFIGSIQFDGKLQSVAVSGSPYGKITIRVGGNTVYDKKPFIAKDSVSFTVAGHEGTFTWQQLGLGKLECDISIDGNTTTLSRVDYAGHIIPPMDARARTRTQLRVYGFLILAAGISAILFNYSELGSGHYDPKLLGVAPSLVLWGIFLIVKQRNSRSSRSCAVSSLR